VISAAGALEELAGRGGPGFPNLLAARERTAVRLAELRERVAQMEVDPDAAVVLFGSWGRRELTSQSDDDFLVLVEGRERDGVKPQPDELRAAVIGAGEREPGAHGGFGEVAFCADLVERIGLDEDLNRNLTRRMLLVLESVAVAGDDVHRRCFERVIDGYLSDSLQDRHPPRFFINDLIRYWRTICVDFVGKEREGPEKWALRNAKLRTSRKLLFASGLLPLLLCQRFRRDEIRPFLLDQFSAPPTDRVAYAFLAAGAIDPGTRALSAYDRWLGMLDDPDVRARLQSLPREDAKRSPVFQEVRRLADELEQGLLALLFDTPQLRALVREYGIF
jgi:hypothetical protein